MNESAWDHSLLTLGIAVVLFISQPVASFWIVRPIYRAAHSEHSRVRYAIGDFFSLCLLIQVPLGVAYVTTRDAEGGKVTLGLFCVISAIICGYIWFVGVGLLSRADIRPIMHRMICLTLVIPLAFFGVPALGVLGIVFVASPFEEWQQATHVSVWVSVSVMLVLAVITCGVYTRWLVRQLKQPQPLPTALEDEASHE